MRLVAAALLLAASTALCGAASSRTVRVYEDPRVPSRRTIALHVVVYPAKHATGDALFLLTGSAGETSIPQRFPAQLLLALRATHDLVFIDPRGTGESNALKCDLFPTTQSHFESLYQLEAVRACRADLEDRADLNLYQTWFAADDLDRVRNELGYHKIALYGDRYGAEVALQYMRRYGKNVNAAILSRVYAGGTQLLLQRPVSAEWTMSLLFRNCAADAACASHFPDLKAHFAEVLQRFDGGFADVSVRNPENGNVVPVRMRRVVFVETLRRLLSSRDTFAMVPVVIEEAYRGNYEPIAAAKVHFDGLQQEGIAAGLELSEYCSERVPFVTLAQMQHAARGTFYGDDAFRELQAACAIWNVHPADSRFLQPVRTPVPILTIAATGESALLRFMPHGHQLLVDDPLETAQSTCADVIVLDFLARPQAKRNRTLRCTSTTRATPFALSLPPSLSG
jgi:pimeloyl-ACP methyl ester carboxylesterase